MNAIVCRAVVSFYLVISITGCVPAQDAASRPVYPAEEIYDTSVHPDEALVNVRVACNRWPDCATLSSAIEDIFRLEGVQEKRDEDKALALWKWFRILVSSTGGGYVYEGREGKEKIVRDPHKIFTVYGHHQCDGLSWTMVPLWRAAGYIAFDECHLGHTIASLRYRDDDGNMRFHSFDPQARYFFWDSRNNRVSTWTMPVMTGRVHRHVTTPQRLHSLRTSLRIGETIERKWNNEGHVIPAGRDKNRALAGSYYAYRPGRTNGVYAAAGEEVQTLEADTTPEHYDAALCEGSGNTACSATQEGRAALHPRRPKETASFIYRLAPPYVIADAFCEAGLVKGDPTDVCRLMLSSDGRKWEAIHVKEKVGGETMRVNIGKEARARGLPNVYTAYEFFIKGEFKTSGDVRGVGMNGLRVVVFRELNKRTLPNLRPGKNHLRVTADKILEGLALRLEVNYEVKGNRKSVVKHVRRFPSCFVIDVPGVSEHVTGNYDQDFNSGELRMVSFKMRLVPAAATREKDGAFVRDSVARREFSRPFPHPADMVRRKEVRTRETSLMQTSGFFPQSTEESDEDQEMVALVTKLRSGGTTAKWRAAQELGRYPRAVDALLEALPRADIDLTLFICKALAQIKDKKAVPALLVKWRRAPRGAPGTRYIPDVLAAIGDPSVVPHLVEPLRRCRFDFRFHIAHALGILGGPEAEKALRDLARNDPLRAVREEAEEALERLRSVKSGP